jgi:hypothetical protein
MKKENGVILTRVGPREFQFGGMTTIEKAELFPLGCYAYLPEFEAQTSLYFESNTCVAQSFNNAAETLFAQAIEAGMINQENQEWLKEQGYFKNGKINFNDRALAIASGTDPDNGNSGWQVFQTARAKGLAAENAWPWDWRERDPKINNRANYWNEFKFPVNVEEQMAEFKKRFTFLAEWVERKDWKTAQRYGMLQVYVNAWYFRNGRYYNPTGKFNHATAGAEYKYLEIFDTYTPMMKNLEAETDAYDWILKINIKQIMTETPIVKIENNSLIFCAEGPGEFGLYLDGQIIVDDLAKTMAMWFMSNNGRMDGKTRTLNLAQWNQFQKINLKKEKI